MVNLDRLLDFDQVKAMDVPSRPEYEIPRCEVCDEEHPTSHAGYVVCDSVTGASLMELLACATSPAVGAAQILPQRRLEETSDDPGTVDGGSLEDVWTFAMSATKDLITEFVNSGIFRMNTEATEALV